MKAFNPKKITNQIIKFLQQEIKKAGFDKVIIGLSGGIDSAAVAFLAVKALGAKNVLIALLPYKNLNHDSGADLVIKQLKIPAKNLFEIEILKMAELFKNSFTRQPLAKLNKIRMGNIIARVRMIFLYDLAKAQNALVCGTENKSEYLLGYFTRFGDEASDIEPIRHLYKTEVKKLAKYLGVPEKIIKKAPTANLWPGQTDEGELGFSYQQADPILSLYFDQKKSWEEMVKKGFNSQLVEKVKRQVEKNKFKHEAPNTLY